MLKLSISLFFVIFTIQSATAGTINCKDTSQNSSIKSEECDVVLDYTISPNAWACIHRKDAEFVLNSKDEVKAVSNILKNTNFKSGELRCWFLPYEGGEKVSMEEKGKLISTVLRGQTFIEIPNKFLKKLE